MSDRDLIIAIPGHKYIIPNLDGDGEHVIQFVSRPPHHEPVEGILIQDLLRIIIDRIKVLDAERPWPPNQDSIRDLRVVLARQEARALVESVAKGKLQYPEYIPVGPDGHFDWAKL